MPRPLNIDEGRTLDVAHENGANDGAHQASSRSLPPMRRNGDHRSEAAQVGAWGMGES